MCPESVWDNGMKFWYNAYHCLFFLDYYLTLEPAKFKPSAIAEAEFEDRMPERRSRIDFHALQPRRKC